ncbi:hypothetical protein A2U01_0005926 [Trifolium medium]|uniref:Uncharacterized protein n=1 Tax=Trifolium medium TaxID=97028 RepID=A0A392MFP4_9FABA|nr:hypothetical protein [Trifolium medium]
MVVKMAILNLGSHTSTVLLPLAVFVYGQKRKLVGVAEIAVQRSRKGGIVRSLRSRSSSSQIWVRGSGSWHGC